MKRFPNKLPMAAWQATRREAGAHFVKMETARPNFGLLSRIPADLSRMNLMTKEISLLTNINLHSKCALFSGRFVDILDVLKLAVDERHKVGKIAT